MTEELTMKCKRGKWISVRAEGRSLDPLSSLEISLPCEDDPSEACEVNKGHCLQYTEMGAKMEKKCAGTCGMKKLKNTYRKIF